MNAFEHCREHTAEGYMNFRDNPTNGPMWNWSRIDGRRMGGASSPLRPLFCSQ